MSDNLENAPSLSRKDFISSSEPRWCLGCGTYSTFSAITKLFLNSGLPREKFAVISGIGCSSRLPYYSNTYGFHTIHGRAPTVAMGLKMADPDLNVWVITGDGDCLSIGGNHFIHLMRRNPNIKVVLFNNQIYGLTKGQTSPTSALGKKTKSTPFGSIDRPMSPLNLALGAGATFVARAPDTDNDLLNQVLTAAAAHKGAAIVEVLINCVIFNDGVFSPLTDKASKADNTVKLENGKPLLFGSNMDLGLRMNGTKPEVVKVGDGGVPLSEIILHDSKNQNPEYAFMLAEMMGEGFPVSFGVLRDVEDYVYHPHTARGSDSDLTKILQGSDSWVHENNGTIHDLELNAKNVE